MCERAACRWLHLSPSHSSISYFVLSEVLLHGRFTQKSVLLIIRQYLEKKK